MKLVIFAVLLLIGGIPNIFSEENMIAGVVCTVIGVVLIAIKVNITKEKVIAKSEQKERVEQAILHMKVHDEYDAFIAKWRPIIDEHYRLSQAAEKAYSDSIKAGAIDGPVMQRAIELCQHDICLEEKIRQYEKEIIQRDLEMGYTTREDMPRSLAGYPSFKRLAIIYEKQKRYDDAIAVCQCAIEAGRIDDGTKGKMYGRLENLRNKKEKETQALKANFDPTDIFD